MQGIVLVSITRDTEFIIPHGNTVLLPWDRILVLTQDDTLHLLTDAWEPPTGPGWRPSSRAQPGPGAG